jgi:hypothetical protein
MSMAPNPAEDATVITLNQASEGDILVQVFDLAGALVQEKRLSNAPAGTQQLTLDTRMMNAGTYFVRASSQHNNIIKHEKLVVVH